MSWLKQSTAITVKMGPALDNADGDTEETGLTIAQADIRLTKNGGAYAQSNNAAGATHDEKGNYGIPLDTTDTDTLGTLRVHIHVAGALAFWDDFMVVPANVWDSFFASDKLQVDLNQIGGDAQSATDLKDFADAGYDPATNKVEGVKLVDTTTTNTDMRGTENAALASVCTEARLAELDAANLPADIDAIPTTAMRGTDGANTDKIGFSLSVAGILAIWDQAVSALTTPGKIGKLLVDNIDAAISSRSSHSVANIWDALLSGMVQAGSVGKKLADLILSSGKVTVGTNDDKIGYSISGAKTTLDALQDITAANVKTQADQALADIDLDHISKTGAAPTPTIGSNLDKIMNKDGGQTFSPATDSLEAVRDRGDVAWITGGGGGITDIINIQPLIPHGIDLANTATYRFGIMIINSLDDLPSGAEITPGTISLDRKAIGGTSWSSIVSDAAMSEIAGLVYYDEVLDAGAGYAEGDSIRVTMKSVKVTVAANDYEIIGSTGRMFYTSIRQTMRGTDGANTTTPPTAVENRQEMDSNSTKLSDIVGDTNETQGKLPTNNIMGSSVKTDKDDEIDSIKSTVEGLPTAGNNADQVWDEQKSGHVAAGSFGETNQKVVPSETIGDYKADVSNLDETVSSRSSHSAADIWSVANRSLTDFGTLVADVVSGVWAYATRTLTAGTKDSEIDEIKTKTDNHPADLDAEITLIKGALGFNCVLDDFVYDGNGKATGGNLYIYDSAANANTHDKATGLLKKIAGVGVITAGNTTKLTRTEA